MVYPVIVRKLALHIASKRGMENIFWRAFFFSKDLVWSLPKVVKNFFVLRERIRKSLQRYKRVKSYHKISFCVTSMDRLCHLEKTLIKNIKNNISYRNVEFILLDYNSKDGLSDWVKKNCKKYLKNGILKYHRVEWPKTFHMANAKNIAHSLATGDVLCALDADNFTNKDFAFYINFEFNKNKNIIGHSTGVKSDFGGRIFVSRENFHRLQGYDEKFVGWGLEDVDFRERSFESGLKSVRIPICFLDCIEHSNELRFKNMAVSQKYAYKHNKALFRSKREEAKNKASCKQ